MLLIILEYAILAATFTLAKKALSFAPPFFLVMMRLLIAGFFLTMYAYFRNAVKWKKVQEDAWLFIAAGLFHSYFAFVPEFWALQFVTSAKTSIIYAATPFVAALFSYFFYSERLTGYQWLGMLVGTAGLAPLIIYKSEPTEWGGLLSLSVPELVLIGAMMSACFAWFIIKKLMKRGHSVAMINGAAMSIGGLLCIPTVLVAEPHAISLVSSWSGFIGWLSVLIILSHFISYNLYSWLLTQYSITFMTFCGFLCPLFSTLFGALFLGEHITWHYFASIFGITLGLVLFALHNRNTTSA